MNLHAKDEETLVQESYAHEEPRIKRQISGASIASQQSDSNNMSDDGTMSGAAINADVSLPSATVAGDIAVN